MAENVNGDKFGMKAKNKLCLINHYAGFPDIGVEFRAYYPARGWRKMEYQEKYSMRIQR